MSQLFLVVRQHFDHVVKIILECTIQFRIVDLQLSIFIDGHTQIAQGFRALGGIMWRLNMWIKVYR